MPDSAEQKCEPGAHIDGRPTVDHVTQPHGCLLVIRFPHDFQRGGALEGRQSWAHNWNKPAGSEV